MQQDWRFNRPTQDAATRRQMFGPVRPMHEPSLLERFIERMRG